MFSRQNIPDKGLICKILCNKELAGTTVGVSSVLGIPFRKYDLISKKILTNRSGDWFDGEQMLRCHHSLN
jgi:hypothetical protein